MKKISIAIVTLILLITCTKEEIDPRPYPRVITNAVDNISSGAVLFQGEIIYSSVEIIDHGFTWSTNPEFLGSDVESISLGTKKGKGNFESLVNRNLDEGAIYYVKAYVKSMDFKVYGNIVKFLGIERGSPAVIDFFPSVGSLTDTITIVGKNFSSKANSNIVKFNSSLSTVVSATGDLLRVIVPENLSDITSSISIEVAGKTVLASSQFTLKTPQLLTSNKMTINLCDTVVFDVMQVGPTSNPKIYFNDRLSEVIGKTKEQIKVLVPALPSGNADIHVKLLVGSFESTLLQTLNLSLPDFINLEPEETSFLDTITMHVSNMPHCEFEVKIDGNAVPILESTADYFKVIVPASLNDPWRIGLRVFFKNEIMFDTLYYRVLRIESVTPTSGVPGDIVTIKGMGFHPILNNNIVCFTCQGTGFGDHGEIISGNTRELKVKIPATPPNKIGISIFTQNMGNLNFPFEVK